MKRLFAALITVTAACLAQNPEEGLLQYVRKPLYTLGTNDLQKFRSAMEKITGDDFRDPWNILSFWPRLLSPYKTDLTEWVFIEARVGFNVPDESEIRLRFYDKSWSRIAYHQISTGWRRSLYSVTVQKHRELDAPLIVARTKPTGPFIFPAGKTVAMPTSGPHSFEIQFYALQHTNLVLIRLEDANGDLLRNQYSSDSLVKGPPVYGKNKADWIKNLESTNLIDQMAALAWLTGIHFRSDRPISLAHDQGLVDDFRIFRSVRDDLRTIRMLKTLGTHQNKWMRDYGKLWNDNR